MMTETVRAARLLALIVIGAGLALTDPAQAGRGGNGGGNGGGKGGKGGTPAQCSDHIDNDGDGFCDFAWKKAYCTDGSIPGDLDCSAKDDDTESDGTPPPPPPPPDDVRAFPGAEGFGAETMGGRGGALLEVTNLDDDGPGSLRAAAEAAGPRIIVFRTGGTIELATPIVIDEPYLTIAGQTAPGGGITLKGEGLIIATHEVIVRGLRIRIGDLGEPTCCRDGINISTTRASADMYNIIIDHCSVSWGIDENISTWRSSGNNHQLSDVTIQWSITSEALDDSIHIDEGDPAPAPHSMGMLIGARGASRISIHHNLLAHNRDRNPRISGIFEAEVINNLVYDWGGGPIKTSSDQETVHIWHNYSKAGANSRHAEILLHDFPHADSQYDIFGNLGDDPRHAAGVFAARIENENEFPLAGGAVFVPSDITLDDALDVPALVLGNAGVIAPARDAVDQRILDQVAARTGAIIDSQDDVGGWPTLAAGTPPTDSDHDGMPDSFEIANGLDPDDPADGNDLAPSGYTWIEDYINSLIPMP